MSLVARTKRFCNNQFIRNNQRHIDFVLYFSLLPAHEKAFVKFFYISLANRAASGWHFRVFFHCLADIASYIDTEISLQKRVIQKYLTYFYVRKKITMFYIKMHTTNNCYHICYCKLLKITSEYEVDFETVYSIIYSLISN